MEEKPSTKEIWMVDDTICDMQVHDTQEDQAHAEGQAEGELGRPKPTCLIDPYSGLVVAFRLSYEEMKSEN